jgi:dihydroorotate dehydrogenase (NAD+) catalytic subunit
MIELAPDYKRSLTLNNPILHAAGGYGAPFDSANIGALITSPLTWRARVGAPLPRVVEISGGVLLRTGAANPGLPKILREYRRMWETSPIPIIIAFAAQGVDDWATMATQLEGVAGVGGIELDLNPTINAAHAIRAIRAASELPILAKLDLDNARAIAGACVAAGANTLVVARAPRGMMLIQGKPWYGRWFSPAAKIFALDAVTDISKQNLGAPIIACGGIHSANDAREFLTVGACAIEIDSAEWIEPGVSAKIAGAFMETQSDGTRTNANEL